MTVFGPDVSKWQAGLVPPEPPGIGFGICRATNGMSPDQTVTNVINWCKARNMPFAAYHFVYPIKSHPAVAQAEAFHNIVGSSKINCMLDWEEDKDDNCHPDGGPQVPKWDDVLAVAAEIRKLGHKVPLLYANYYYWKDTCGSPTLTGQGFDLVNAKYGNNNAIATPQASYAAQGGDSGPGWNGYGGIVMHHDADNTSGDDDWVLKYEYETARDGPIGNFHVQRDGDVWFGAAGASNHAGKGGPVSTSRGTVPLNTGNLYLIGIEASNNGVGEVWPTAQMESYLILVTVLCKTLQFEPTY